MKTIDWVDTDRAQCRGVKGFPSSWINVLNSSKTSKQSSCPEEEDGHLLRYAVIRCGFSTF